MNNLIKTTSQALMQQLQIDFEQPFTAYAPQPGATEFSFSWPVENGEFIVVYKNNLPLIYETDYLVSLNPSPLLGGLVTLINATVIDDQIVITRNSTAQRISSYTQNGFFSAATLNNDINFLIMLIQELKLQMSRTIKLPDYTIDTSGLTLPSRVARANSVLGFDELGNILIRIDPFGNIFAQLAEIEAKLELLASKVDVNTNDISNVDTKVNTAIGQFTEEIDGINKNKSYLNI